MKSRSADPTILIASYLEPEYVARIRDAYPSAQVVYEPQLLRPPRYAADHKGSDHVRSAEEEQRWQRLLSQATILFDFDQTHLTDLPEMAPNVEWIQATSAGIGQFVRRLEYAKRLPHTTFTTARGVHAQPLAEFAVMAMLMHTRRALHMVAAQGEKAWARFAGTDLADKKLTIVGLGAVGGAVARVASALGMRVVGVRRGGGAAGSASADVDEIYNRGQLSEALSEAEFVVLIAPHTDETEGMIGAEQLARLRPGAALINIGRGALVDEIALVAALESGQLGGAYLDVFQTEPLPKDHRLWSMPNVLVSPHSGSTSDRENERIADLFIDNLGRWTTGEPLLNVLDTERLY